MENQPLSDLAKAVTQNRRITPSIEASQAPTTSIGGTQIPKGSVSIMESANIPKGSQPVYFSKDKKPDK